MSGLDAEHRRRLEAALEQMNPRQREIFLAVRVDGLPYPEIAARTGLTVKQVEQAFATSLLVLFAALETPPPARKRRRWRARIATWWWR